MLILPTPADLSAASFSEVTVSGLPASTVYSRRVERLKLSLIAFATRES